MTVSFVGQEARTVFGAPTSTPELRNGPLPSKHQNPKSQGRPNRTERVGEGVEAEGKSAAPELRSTLPRIDSARRTARAQPPSLPPSHNHPDTSKPLERELKEATEQLELLQKRRDEAVKAKDSSLHSNIEYFAIPDVKWRIEQLKGRQERDGETAPLAAGRQGRGVPHALVETDGESSEGADSKAVEISDSEF